MKLQSVPHMQAARNCLVGERNVVKVADYSLALYTSPRKPSRTVVSIRWAAPELIVQQPIFTTKSDVWSFGKSIVIAMAIHNIECHIRQYLHALSNGMAHKPVYYLSHVVMLYNHSEFYSGVVMWELWSGAQTPYLDLRNQEVKGKVNAMCESSKWWYLVQ